MGQKVMSLPTLAIYENGQKGETVLKEGINESNIEDFIQRHI